MIRCLARMRMVGISTRADQMLIHTLVAVDLYRCQRPGVDALGLELLMQLQRRLNGALRPRADRPALERYLRDAYQCARCLQSRN